MSAHVEIERKFEIPVIPADLEAVDAVEIRQGYLAIDDGVEVRIRRAGHLCTLTTKGPGRRERLEVELELSESQFEALWPLAAARSLKKLRYKLKSMPPVEVDIYEDALAGLVIAEVEFSSREAALLFTPPAWFGREVTQDSRYKNSDLARFGRPEGAHDV